MQMIADRINTIEDLEIIIIIIIIIIEVFIT